MVLSFKPQLNSCGLQDSTVSVPQVAAQEVLARGLFLGCIAHLQLSSFSLKPLVNYLIIMLPVTDKSIHQYSPTTILFCFVYSISFPFSDINIFLLFFAVLALFLGKGICDSSKFKCDYNIQLLCKCYRLFTHILSSIYCYLYIFT